MDCVVSSCADNRMVDLSVVVATFNRSSKIVSLLEDLARQSFSEGAFEVIVVDDGSRDATYTVVREWILSCRGHEGYSGTFVLLRQENQGQAVARQAGVELARGRVLLFLDDDMRIPPPDFLERHYAHHSSPQPTVVYGKMQPPIENTPRQPFEYFYERSLNRMYAAFESGRLAPCGMHFFTGNVSLSRETFITAGGFDRTFRQAEDKELGLRIENKVGANFVFEPLALSLHYSDTPSLRSFAGRAFLYGKFDWQLAALYPKNWEASPAAILRAGSFFRRLLVSLMLCSASCRISCSYFFEKCAAFIAPTPQTGKRMQVGARYTPSSFEQWRRSLAAMCCSFVFLANYISGVLEAARRRETVMRLMEKYNNAVSSSPQLGTSFWADVRQDLRMILAFEKRKPTLINLIWCLFGMDAGMVLLLFRVRQALRRWHIPFANHILRSYQSMRYGIELGNEIELGHGVYFVHSLGTVVGGRSRIGRGTILMGCNTIGTAKENGHPFIGEGVLIGAGTRVLGPVYVGDGAILGANSVVLHDVPAGATAVGLPAKVLSSAVQPFREPESEQEGSLSGTAVPTLGTGGASDEISKRNTFHERKSQADDGSFIRPRCEGGRDCETTRY